MKASAFLSVLACLATAVATHASLIGSWNLDETSGDFIDNAGPIASNGTNSGGVGYGSPSVPAGTYGAINVTPAIANALDTAINVPFNASVFLGSAAGSDLNRTGDFTIAAWVQPTQTTGRHMFFATGAGGENGWKVGQNGTGLRFTANGVVDQDVPLGSYTLTANTWVHWAVSVAGTAGTRTTTYYVNGNQVHQSTIGDIRVSTSPNMMIGNNGQEDPGTPGGSSFNENFNGLIDHVKYYDTVLDQQGIIAAAIPEPSSATLSAFGALGLCLARRFAR